MKSCRSTMKDRYCITISSQRDAHKNAKSITASRPVIFIAIASAVLILAFSVGAAVYSVQRLNLCRGQAETLANQVSAQSAMLDYYQAQMMMQQQEAAEDTAVIQNTSDRDGGTILAEDAAEGSSQTIIEDDVEIPVRDAVKMINETFVDSMDELIVVAKMGKPADTTEVVYSGDVEGDSETVNNWADVLAVFTVQSGYDLGTLEMITGEEYRQIAYIYDEMNQVVISSETATEQSETMQATTTLTLCVTINSMSCMEYVETLGWTEDQKHCLEALMTPDYYMTFAALLGVDLYDGLNSEELSAIIEGLEPGSIGETIVQAALTRLGDPYSRGRRGSGDYVDCSYFTYWAYKQAGIILPTSSIEQARYCEYNDYSVTPEDLKPGDLIYWSKTSCHCGRWREIHHAGIYIGNGMIIDASSSKGCVVIRKLWSGGEWRIAMYARPYTEEQDSYITTGETSG